MMGPVDPDLDDTAPPSPARERAYGEALAALEDTVVLTAGSRPRPAAGVAAVGGASDATEDAARLRVELPDGASAPLEGIVVVGRAPRPEPTWSEPVQLLRVTSPRKEVSGTHLELRRIGSTVVATDLRSTNGTIATLAGHRARPLLRGESIVVGPGTRLDLGEGVVLRILEGDAPSERHPAAAPGGEPPEDTV